MKHLLNLYTEELREKPVPYGFPWLIGSMIVVTLFVVAYGFYLQQKVTQAETAKKSLETRQKELQNGIAALEAQLASPEQRDLVEQERISLLEDIQGRQRLLDELGHVLEQPLKGFSLGLHGLAEASGHGVWITTIRLVGEQGSTAWKEVRLIGRTYQGEHIPDYIDALSRAKAFQGVHFNSMQAVRPETEGQAQRAASAHGASAFQGLQHGYVTFLLSTRQGDSLQRDELR